MYDFAHSIEDAVEGITHSICTLEFEDHRPLYDWVLKNVGFWEHPPKQIEFARLNLTDTVMSKRILKGLVDEGVVDGWDDPRMPTIAGLRRRGYTPEAIRNFCEEIGVSKSNSTIDSAMLEYCIREDLKEKVENRNVVEDPIKVVITNYPEDKTESVRLENNRNVPEMGEREVPFSKKIYIDGAEERFSALYLLRPKVWQGSTSTAKQPCLCRNPVMVSIFLSVSLIPGMSGNSSDLLDLRLIRKDVILIRPQ